MSLSRGPRVQEGHVEVGFDKSWVCACSRFKEARKASKGGSPFVIEYLAYSAANIGIGSP